MSLRVQHLTFHLWKFDFPLLQFSKEHQHERKPGLGFTANFVLLISMTYSKHLKRSMGC